MKRPAVIAAAALLLAAPVAAQTLTVDFARPSPEPPLVKTKFGVYQTPLISMPALLRSTDLLAELNIQNLRYEMGWGKPDVLAFDQIGGTASRPTINFAALDPFFARLRAQNVRPLLALTYCPNPLKSQTGWPAWKDLPNDLAAWKSIVGQYAAHYKGKTRPFYEAWNEPDITEPGGKMFFSGGPAEYGRLYGATETGVTTGDKDAQIGGAATAYDLRYFDAIGKRKLDFASIHAYENFAGQIAAMRGRLKNKPETPIFLTEYASFTTFGKDAPVSRHPAAMRFFRDARQMLTYPDLAQVYWAQWVDDGLGMITSDGHRKALFNAFKIYGMMPVDRTVVTPESANGVGAMASSDNQTAAVVLWNEHPDARTVTVNLTNLPPGARILNVFRIDRDHASYVDNPASENLTVIEKNDFDGQKTTWTGTIPGESVVFLQAGGAARKPPSRVGEFVRVRHQFADRNAPAWADFDPQTSLVRLGVGDTESGDAQIGVVWDNPVPKIAFRVQTSGPFARKSLLGLRFDFSDTRQDEALLFQKEMRSGQPFVVTLARLAPPGWNGRRVCVTFVLRNAGRGAQARIALTPGH